MTIRALIVDDEPLAREAVRIRLAAVGDIAVVGEASSGCEWGNAAHRTTSPS